VPISYFTSNISLEDLLSSYGIVCLRSGHSRRPWKPNFITICWVVLHTITDMINVGVASSLSSEHSPLGTWLIIRPLIAWGSPLSGRCAKLLLLIHLLYKLNTVGHIPVAKRGLCQQRPFLSNGSVNTFPPKRICTQYSYCRKLCFLLGPCKRSAWR
jgi:hypothetical protein